MDAWSIPEKVPWINGQVRYHYWRFDDQYAITTQMMGLIFKGRAGPRTWLYEVTSDKVARYPETLQGYTNFEGNVVIEMNSPIALPDTKRPWKLEPLGSVEGTTETGLVVRVPKFRFWKYADTGQDAEAPPNVVVPPQYPKQPEDPTATPSR